MIATTSITKNNNIHTYDIFIEYYLEIGWYFNFEESVCIKIDMFVARMDKRKYLIDQSY